MDELSQALRDLNEKKVYEIVEERINRGVTAVEIVNACNAGMIAVGEKFSTCELLQGAAKGPSAGIVVIGTVKGDIHDIGKNLVVTLLRGAGFEVVDLGVDVPAERFIAALKDSGAKILGLSALLNFTYPEMKHVVEQVRDAGLRDRVKIIIGGAPCNEQVRQFTGADYYAVDAVAGVGMCRQIYGSPA